MLKPEIYFIVTTDFAIKAFLINHLKNLSLEDFINNTPDQKKYKDLISPQYDQALTEQTVILSTSPLDINNLIQLYYLKGLDPQVTKMLIESLSITIQQMIYSNLNSNLKSLDESLQLIYFITFNQDIQSKILLSIWSIGNKYDFFKTWVDRVDVEQQKIIIQSVLITSSMLYSKDDERYTIYTLLKEFSKNRTYIKKSCHEILPEGDVKQYSASGVIHFLNLLHSLMN